MLYHKDVLDSQKLAKSQTPQDYYHKRYCHSTLNYLSFICWTNVYSNMTVYL